MAALNIFSQVCDRINTNKDSYGYQATKEAVDFAAHNL